MATPVAAVADDDFGSNARLLPMLRLLLSGCNVRIVSHLVRRAVRFARTTQSLSKCICWSQRRSVCSSPLRGCDVISYIVPRDVARVYSCCSARAGRFGCTARACAAARTAAAMFTRRRRRGSSSACSRAARTALASCVCVGHGRCSGATPRRAKTAAVSRDGIGGRAGARRLYAPAASPLAAPVCTRAPGGGGGLYISLVPAP